MVRCLITDKTKGEKLRILLNENELINPKYKIKIIKDKIYIPLKKEADISIIKNKEIDFLVSDEKFESKNRELSLKLNELLKGHLPEIDENLLPRSYDIIGEIALIHIKEEIWDKRRDFGKIIYEKLKNIRGVFAIKSHVKGTYRIREIENIGGKNNSITEHHENGCIFHLDLSKVYFNSRLSFERLRVAKQVSNKEIVTDMFAGVGPFSILIAKKIKAQVNAIDINPDAINYLYKNIIANKISDLVRVFNGNSDEIIKKYLRNSSDRIIMNLPESSIDFFETALLALKKSGGIIHYYTFTEEEKLKDVLNSINQKIVKNNLIIQNIYTKKVREVSPYYYQYVFDINLKRIT